MSRATQENIKKLLELTGMTHEELGRIAGVQRSSVSHWTRGGSEPRMAAAQRIARYFGLHESNIVDPNGMAYVTVDSEGHLHDNNAARMRDVFHEMLERFNSDDGESLAAYKRYVTAVSKTDSTMELSQKERDLVTDYRRLNSHKKKLVRDLVNTLANPDRDNQTGFKKELPPAQEE